MDLQEYPLEELLRTAIKSEEDSYQIYHTLNSRVNGDMLSTKLKFISNEERKHKGLLEEIFHERFPDTALDLDRPTDVPLPFLNISPGNIPLGDVLEKAMESEKITQDFYRKWLEIYPTDDEVKKTLDYLSRMELSHYELLKRERERLTEADNEEIYWPKR